MQKQFLLLTLLSLCASGQNLFAPISGQEACEAWNLFCTWKILIDATDGTDKKVDRLFCLADRNFKYTTDLILDPFQFDGTGKNLTFPSISRKVFNGDALLVYILNQQYNVFRHLLTIKGRSVFYHDQERFKNFLEVQKTHLQRFFDFIANPIDIVSPQQFFSLIDERVASKCRELASATSYTYSVVSAKVDGRIVYPSLVTCLGALDKLTYIPVALTVNLNQLMIDLTKEIDLKRGSDFLVSWCERYIPVVDPRASRMDLGLDRLGLRMVEETRLCI